MKNKITRAVLAATLLLSAVGAAEAQTIGGRYAVQGTNFDGSAYRGTAVIQITSNTTCRIVWNTGGESRGICMRMANAFTASYRMPNGTIGLAIYQIFEDGRMEGTWTLADQNGSGTEVLIPAR